jgi:hypothetical protein
MWSYTDTLAKVALELTAPAAGFKVQVNPISGAAYDVNFSWSRPSEATDYMIQIAFDTGFKEVAFQDRTTHDGTTDDPLSFIVGPGQQANILTYMPGQSYYWRVKASAPISSGWSEARSFVIEPGGAVVPLILSPSNGADGIDVNPAFSWSPVSGASKYEWAMAAAPHAASFRSPIAQASLAETGIRPNVKLEEGRTYFWRVRAVEPVVGDWSTIANFAVATAPEPAPPPVVIKEVPAPIINIPPAPAPPPDIVIPPAPVPPAPIAPAYIWAVIIIGAILVIAVIVLIVRTRRAV